MIGSEGEARRAIDKALNPTLINGASRFDELASWSGPASQQGGVLAASGASSEYRDLMGEAKTPYGLLLVKAVVPNLMVSGFTTSDGEENDGGEGWATWQRNGMSGLQIPLVSDVARFGVAYTFTEPGVDPLTGGGAPLVRLASPRRAVALYRDPADVWPEVACRLFVSGVRTQYVVVSGNRRWLFESTSDDAELDDSPTVLASSQLRLVSETVMAGWPDVTPVQAFKFSMNGDYGVMGAVEPVIPLLKRLDQDSCDRLVAQRFTAWVVRTVTGLGMDDGQDVDATEEEIAAARERLRVRLGRDNILAAEDKDVRFGTLGATDLNPFIAAEQQDQMTLVSVGSLPPTYLSPRGFSNLSAEAIEAANLSARMQGEMVRALVGEAHANNLRLWSAIAGDPVGAADVESRVRWQDNSSKSLAQVVDAVTKLAPSGGPQVPLTVLWEQLPFMTPANIQRAVDSLQSTDSIDRLVSAVNELSAGGAGVEA